MTIKWYPSQGSDAKVVRVTFSQLSAWYHYKQIWEKVESLSASFSKISDVAFHLDTSDFRDKGYVTLYTNAPNLSKLAHKID